MGFATSKAHKRETQGKFFDLLFFSKDFFKIFRFDFKNLSNNPDENLHENILRENKSRFSRKLLQNVEEVGGRRESQIWRKS